MSFLSVDNLNHTQLPVVPPTPPQPGQQHQQQQQQQQQYHQHNYHPYDSPQSDPHHEWTNDSYFPDFTIYQPPQQLFAIITMLYVVIFTLGLLGNFSVIVVVFRCRSMRTSINKLFLNLCIADLLALVITGPTVVVDMYMREAWHLGSVMCKLVTFLENLVAFASAATILAISVERYRVACRASTNDSRTNCNQLVSFITIWISSMLGAVPILKIVSYELQYRTDGTPVYRCITPIDVHWKKVYIVVTSVLFFILPLLLILCLYLKVYLRLMQLFRREQRKKLTYPREIVRLKRQMTQIIITVVLVFFICHTPFRAFALWSLFATTSSGGGIRNDVFLITVYVTRMLLYSNHAINPFVYNFVSRKFRRALLWLFFKKKRNPCYNEWKELVNTRRPIRMGSYRRQQQQRPSTAGRLFDMDNNCIRDSKMTAGMGQTSPPAFDGCGRDAMLEPDVLLDRHNSHFQRNDFLVLYENLVLE